MATITQDEAALYDRQIRLWGLESQERIRQATVVFAGYTALCNEACKNLVLAGVGRLILVDDVLIREQDLEAQFYFTEAHVGQPRVEVAAKALRELNPRVNIEVYCMNIRELDVKQFDKSKVICWSGVALPQLVTLDEVCRTNSIGFFSAQTYGTFGYIFSDLATHRYIEEQQVAGKAGAEKSTIRTEHTEVYVSLASALAAIWTGLTAKQLRRKVSPLYFTLRTLWEFETEHQRLPKAEDANDLNQLKIIRKRVTDAMGVAETVVPDELIRQLADASQVEFAPVCAILGGILAQEILKVVSGKDLPVANFFAYNGVEGTGLINTLK
ncbi:hypothetical protein BDF22DRAFT_746933 [Syncephalis plumigaleata]|nr:hypothetical protein BDF22DRAFT_746933 [Syncephalis plumigaleata]